MQIPINQSIRWKQSCSIWGRVQVPESPCPHSLGQFLRRLHTPQFENYHSSRKGTRSENRNSWAWFHSMSLNHLRVCSSHVRKKRVMMQIPGHPTSKTCIDQTLNKCKSTGYTDTQNHCHHHHHHHSYCNHPHGGVHLPKPLPSFNLSEKWGVFRGLTEVVAGHFLMVPPKLLTHLQWKVGWHIRELFSIIRFRYMTSYIDF